MREERRERKEKDTATREELISEPDSMPRLTARKGRGRKREKVQRQEKRRGGKGGDPKDEPDSMPRLIQRGGQKE